MPPPTSSSSSSSAAAAAAALELDLPSHDDNLPLLAHHHAVAPPLAHSASLSSAVFNLSTTIIGAGIMALPATMTVLGLPLGLLAILLMGLVSLASIRILVASSARSKSWTYGVTVQVACGSIGRRLADLCIILNNGGILVVYLIIMGEVMAGNSTGSHAGVLPQWLGQNGWWSNRRCQKTM